MTVLNFLKFVAAVLASGVLIVYLVSPASCAGHQVRRLVSASATAKLESAKETQASATQPLSSPTAPSDPSEESEKSGEDGNFDLVFAHGGVAPFSKRFAAQQVPKTLDGAVPLFDNCDVVYVLVAMVQKQDSGFRSLVGNLPLAHREEVCARRRYFNKHNVSDADRKNSFKIEAAREAYMADAQQVIETMKSAKALYWTKYGGSEIWLRHYRPDSQGFELQAGFDGLASIVKTPLAPMIMMSEDDPLEKLQFSPLDVDTSNLTIIKPANPHDALKIEDIVSKADERFYGDVFFLPVSFVGQFSETEDWGRNLDRTHLQVRVTGAIIYSDVLDQRPRVLLSTDSY